MKRLGGTDALFLSMETPNWHQHVGGLTIIEPRDRLSENFTGVIYQIKAGHTGTAERKAMQHIARALVNQGAEAIIVGCTEVPLVLDQSDIAVPLIVSTDVLVARTIAFADKLVR